MNARSIFLVAAAAAALSIAGCRSGAQPRTDEVVTAPERAADDGGLRCSEPTPWDVNGVCVRCRASADCGAGERCDAGGACVPARVAEPSWPVAPRCEKDSDCPTGGRCDENRVCQLACLAPVHFALDSYELDAATRDQLQASAQCISEHGVGYLLLEGHCDARGSDRWNDELGQHRAEAVLRYLRNLGVRTGLSTISFGKAFPVVKDAGSEEQHARNRRVEFRLANQSRADGRQVVAAAGGGR